MLLSNFAVCDSKKKVTFIKIKNTTILFNSI